MATLAEAEILDQLTSLVDKSLVAYEQSAGGADRYHLLETVRQFARDDLNRCGEGAAVRDRQLEFFLGLAEGAQTHFQGPARAAWLQRFDLEYDNLRAALDWGEGAHAETDRPLRLAVGMSLFWWSRGRLTEARSRLSAALSAAGAGTPPLKRAQAINYIGNCAFYQEEMLEARRCYEQSLAIRREHEDHLGAGRALCNLGAVAYNLNDNAKARELTNEGLDLFRKVGNAEGIAGALGLLGEFARSERDDSAEALLAESVEIWRTLDDPGHLSWSLLELGLDRILHRDHESARSTLAEAIGIWRESGDRLGVTCGLEAVGALASLRYNPHLAARLFGAADALRRTTGARMGKGERDIYEPHLEGVRALLGEQEYDRQWRRGRATAWEQAMDEALEWLESAPRKDAT